MKLGHGLLEDLCVSSRVVNDFTEAPLHMFHLACADVGLQPLGEVCLSRAVLGGGRSFQIAVDGPQRLQLRGLPPPESEVALAERRDRGILRAPQPRRGTALGLGLTLDGPKLHAELRLLLPQRGLL